MSVFDRTMFDLLLWFVQRRKIAHQSCIRWLIFLNRLKILVRSKIIPRLILRARLVRLKPVKSFPRFKTFCLHTGSIVRTVNGPNLIVHELVNNMSILKNAHGRLKTESFTTDHTLFIRRLFSPKRQALPNHQTSHDNTYSRFGRPFSLPTNDTVIQYLNT